MSQQHARVSQGQICLDNCMCCHTEIEVPDQTFYLTQSKYTDTVPTNSGSDPVVPVPGWQSSHNINVQCFSSKYECYDLTRESRARSPCLLLWTWIPNHLATVAATHTQMNDRTGWRVSIWGSVSICDIVYTIVCFLENTFGMFWLHRTIAFDLMILKNAINLKTAEQCKY